MQVSDGSKLFPSSTAVGSLVPGRRECWQWKAVQPKASFGAHSLPTHTGQELGPPVHHPELKLVLNQQSASYQEPGKDISGGRRQLWKFLDTLGPPSSLWTEVITVITWSNCSPHSTAPCTHLGNTSIQSIKLRIQSFRDDCISLLYSYL